MTVERVRRRPRRTQAGVPLAAWRTLRNPYRPVEILSEDEVETLHRASLRILDEIGVEVLGDRAIDLFRADGVRIDPETRRVRLDPGRVEELVALAPSQFELHARNPERNVTIGADHVVFCAVGGPAFGTDIDRGRRAGNHKDFAVRGTGPYPVPRDVAPGKVVITLRGRTTPSRPGGHWIRMQNPTDAWLWCLCPPLFTFVRSHT